MRSLPLLPHSCLELLKTWGLPLFQCHACPVPQRICLLQYINSPLPFAFRTQPFATVDQQCLQSIVELFNACSPQVTFGSMGSQMREHLKEEEDIGLGLLRKHFSEKEVAPVSINIWHLLKEVPC